MDVRHIILATAAGLFLPSPASAQDSPIVENPQTDGGVVFRQNPSGMPTSPVAAPCPTPDRPGMLGWRRRHAERKRHLQETFLGYPEEFNEWPLGWALYSHGRTEVANGEAARLIFNHYDFVGDTAELNTRGRDKLTSISAQLNATFAPVIIERNQTVPGLDERRKLSVLNLLAQGPFPVPAERVVIGPAIAPGLRGQEAERVNGFRQTLFYGAGGGISGGGFDTSGLSGTTGSGNTGGGTAR